MSGITFQLYVEAQKVDHARQIFDKRFDSMTCGFTDVYTNYGGLTTRHVLTDEPPRLVCLSLWFVLYYLSFLSLSAQVMFLY